jgi:transposase InsO family protein
MMSPVQIAMRKIRFTEHRIIADLSLECRALNEVREITDKGLHEYKCKRPHQSLNYLVPEEYQLFN